MCVRRERMCFRIEREIVRICVRRKENMFSNRERDSENRC